MSSKVAQVEALRKGVYLAWQWRSPRSRFAAMLPYLDELLWVKGADAKNK